MTSRASQSTGFATSKLWLAFGHGATTLEILLTLVDRDLRLDGEREIYMVLRPATDVFIVVGAAALGLWMIGNNAYTLAT